ncbi:KTN1 [Linum perenne]
MFRLHKIKSDRLSLGERIDFKISSFKALQVPRGWDKLYVTVISVETGKTIARLSKSAVRNGGCHWEESFTESVWVSPDESSKVLEDCVFRFVVAMGSARSGILGETTVNMSSYIGSSSAVLVSFPLKKCDYATVLQAKIQCLTPIASLRYVEGKEENLINQDGRKDLLEDEEEDTKSDQESDTASPKSGGSYGSSDTGSPPGQDGPVTREASSSATNSPGSEDSEEVIAGRPGLFPSQPSLVTRREITGSGNGVSRANYVVDSPRSERSVPTRRIPSRQQGYDSVGTRLTNSGNLGALRTMDQTFLEAAEETIGDLRTQAKMWERTARKLMLEMDYLKKEHVELSRNQGNLDMELTEACAERDGLRKEIEQLKQLLAKEKMKPPPLDNPSEGTWQMVKELEREISFQKQASGNLTMQLKRSQESNVELVIVLQDLEETLEKQKVEIESLYDMESRFGELEDAMEASTESNKNLMAQVLKLQESEKDLLIKVHELEMALEEGSYGTNSVSNREVESVEMEGRVRELTKELGGEREEVKRLEAGLASKQVENEDLQRYRAGAEARVSVLEKEKEHIELELETVTRENEIASRCLNDLQNDLAMISSNLETHVSANKNLERKSLELERNKQEMELCLSELKQENEDLSAHVLQLETKLRSEASDHKSQISDLQKELKKAESEVTVSAQEIERLKLEMEVKVDKMSKQLEESKAEIKSLETIMQANEEEIRDLQRWKSELETNLSVLQEEKDQLEERMGAIMTENDIATRRSNELQSELTTTRSSLESHVSANETLERKSLELEKEKNDLEQQLSGIEKDNEELLMSITDLENQLRSEASDHESQLNSVEESYKKLLMQIDSDYNDSVEKVEKLRMELEAEVAELKAELSDRKAEIEILDACLHAKEEEVGQLQRQTRESEAKIFDLKEEKCQLKQNMETIMEENDVAARHLNESQQDIMMLRSSVESHVASNNVLETKCLELEGKKEELDLQSLELKQENEQLATRLSEMEAQLRSETDKLESLMHILEEKEEQLKEVENKYNIQSQELESTKREMEVTVSEHARELTEKMAEIKGLESLLQSKEEEIGSLQYLLQSKEEEIGNLQTLMQSKEEEIGNLKSLLKSKEEEIMNLQSVLQSKEVEIVNLQSLMQSKEEEIGNLQSLMQSKEEEIGNLQSLLQSKEEEIGNLQSLLQSKEEEIMNLQSLLQSKEEEIMNLQSLLQSKEEEIMNLQSLQQSKEEEIGNLQSLQQSKEEEIGNLQSLLQSKKEEIGNLQSFMQSKEEEMENLQSLLQSKEEETGNLQSLLQSMEEEIGNLQSLMQSKEEEVRKLQSLLQSKEEEIGNLQSLLQSKEEEIGNLQMCSRESESELVALEKEKHQLEHNMETVLKENVEARNRLKDLHSSLDYHVTAKEVPESDKEELQPRSSERKEECQGLSSTISDLEAKMMHLKRERESKEQVLEKFKSEATSLKHEIARLSDEIETDRTNMKNQILLLNNECMAAQEENECVKIEIQKLQTAAESFREEHNSILENNEELRKKSTDLESHCIYLEATLKNTQLSLDEFSKRVMNLEEENECLEEESHKLQAKTEAFREEHNAYMVKNEELGKKNTDLENQCRHLEGKLKNSQLSLDEFSKRVMNLEEKLSSLEQDSASKVKDLTSELDQLHSKYEERAENKKVAIVTSSEREFNIEELATFKENQERLESENRRITYQFKDFKSSEAKLRTTINGLELNLTVSNYERNILKEEAKKLKSQLLKLGPVHEQVLALKNELNAVKSDKEKLKSSLNLVSTKCQKLEAVKSSLTEEIAVFHKCVYQLEEHKRQRFALEEKLKNMERDLMAKEAMWERDEQASNELNKIRKTNKQLQMRMDELEDEKDDYAARARSLEEELVMIQEEQLNLSSTNNMDFPNHEYREEDVNDDAESFEQQLSNSRNAKSTLRMHSKRYSEQTR